MDIRDRFAGKLLIEWRTRQKMTQAELAAKAQISQGLITQIETFRKKISEATLFKIVKALFPEKETDKMVELFKKNVEMKFEERSDVKNNVIFSESLIISADELKNLELNTDGSKILGPDLNWGYADDIEDMKKKEYYWEQFEKIENLSQKYAIRIDYEIYNKSLAPEIEIGDKVAIEYFDDYDLKNIKNNNIVVLFNNKTNEKFLTKLKILKYGDHNGFIYSCILGQEEVAFKKNIGDFKIKGLVVLIIREPVTPKTEYYFL
ncbi:MAG: helix-turn-helix domain-containing protein [bacterium]